MDTTLHLLDKISFLLKGKKGINHINPVKLTAMSNHTCSLVCAHMIDELEVTYSITLKY